MTRKYAHDGLQKPSVTTILGAVDGSKATPLMQWAANEAVAWVRENCRYGECEFQGWGESIFHVCEDDLNEARFAYKQTSQIALDVGSEVHNAIEVHLRAQLQGTLSYNFGKAVANLSPQAANAFGAFLSWMDEHEVKPIALEQKVYGPTWAGTLDFVGWFDGKIYVIDWKTSKAFYKSMRQQVAAYRWAWMKGCVRQADKDYSRNPEGIADGCGVLRIDKTTGEPEWKDCSKSYEKDLRIFNAAVEYYMLNCPRIAKGAGYVL